uniref:NACHT domain-containing protein n=1 Tax=Amphimedon queenslandica TaxID=400682 RepID=A0A1X7T1K2_AMPQE
TEHLDRVLSELEHFADTEWKSFGLKCGLHYNTLKAIERDAGSTKECFTECVACWLMMKDNVDKKGKPTLQRLADIVEETGDKATAEEIRIQNGIITPAKNLEFHPQVTQPTGMPTTPAQSSTSLWWIMFLVSILVVLIIIAMYMSYMYYALPCNVFDPTVAKPIDEYTSELREKYNKTLTKYKDPDINKYPAAGPTAPAVPFIPLKLIRLKSYQKKADAVFLHNVVDKEMLEHDNFEKIEIEDILKPLTDKPLRFVLIQGEPGIGKSTLAKELTLRWVRQTDAFLADYKNVIFIQLRLETYQKAKTIEDLLIDVDDINETEVMLSINETKGAGVLWILDGFDELPHHLRNSSTSIFIQLIKGDILSKSTVIVTSRHAATDPLLILLEDADSKNVALRGFESNKILEYASKYFKNETVAYEFQSFYSRNTVIENMLYNPMNCFMMCKVFTDFILTNNNKHPVTMTAIYNYYVRALLKRHLIDAKVIDINYEMPLHLIQKNDFRNSKLRNIWKNFYYLSKVAFNGVIKQKYNFGKELHDIPKLSMMDTITSFTVFDNRDESSSFIHATLQDYFAAIYLINNPHFMFNEEDLERNSNLEDVLIFYVGLSKEIDRKIPTLNMLRTIFF